MSRYPLILSIENHCSVDQQKKMAEYMQKVFKEKLLTRKIDPNMRHLPSPEQLKGKILVKNQKLEDETLEEGWVAVEDEADEMDEEYKQESGRTSSELLENQDNGPCILPENSVRETQSVSPRPRLKQLKMLALSVERPSRETRSVSPKPTPKHFMSLPAGRSHSCIEQEQLRLKTSLGRKGRSKSFGDAEDDLQDVIELEPKRKAKLARALSQLVVYTQSVCFRGFCVSQDVKWWQMSSLCENVAQRCCMERRAQGFVHHNRRQLTRIYPAGYRIDSSNFNPQDLWNCGCQIVALNYQKEGKMMQLNRARFRANGSCGYVLKPEPMINDQHFFNPYAKGRMHNSTPILLTVKVISGQQFPKPKGGERGEIIDPYVKLKIFGLPNDQAKRKTKVINDNGFDPIWNESFTFNIIMPELALIRFVVMDKDPMLDDFIGQATFPVNSIREGYRHIRLEGEGIEISTLFVHITKSLAIPFGYENESPSLLEKIKRAFKKSESPSANKGASRAPGEVLLLRRRQIGSTWVHQKTPATPHIPGSSSSNSLAVCEEDEQEELEGEANSGDEPMTLRTASDDTLLQFMQNGHAKAAHGGIDIMVQESFESVFSSEREVSPSSVNLNMQSNDSSSSTREVSPTAIELDMK
jgi:phosphatidylinositol phospholipase C eta